MRLAPRWLGLFLLACSCASPRTDGQRDEWVVVSDLAVAGLQQGPDGSIRGADADLLRVLAESTDRVLVWRVVSSERGLALLESGRADLAIFDPAVIESWGGSGELLPELEPDLQVREGWRVSPLLSEREMIALRDGLLGSR